MRIPGHTPDTWSLLFWASTSSLSPCVTSTKRQSQAQDSLANIPRSCRCYPSSNHSRLSYELHLRVIQLRRFLIQESSRPIGTLESHYLTKGVFTRSAIESRSQWLVGTSSFLGRKNPSRGLERCPMSSREVTLVLRACTKVNRLANGDLLRGYGVTNELVGTREITIG